MKSFAELKRNLKKDFTKMVGLKVALLGDTTTQFLNQALRGTGFDYGFDLNFFEADFNQVENQVFDSSSDLYKFQPDIIILFLSSHKLLQKYNQFESGRDQLAERELALTSSLYSTVKEKLQAKVILYNYNEIDDVVFGNYANKQSHSFLFQLRKLNYELMLLASALADLHICDLSSIQNRFGKNNCFHSSLYVNAEMVVSIDVIPEIAAKTLDLISALHGSIKKCVVFDLDNTIWGGVIGDDGIENIELGNLGIGKAFTEFQYWLKKLKNRGILLAVCSKNTESIAKEAFENHPDMVLHLEDIAFFIANWENKADNIREIQSFLNIGFDSMVFLDDSPFERNLVKQNLPLITVPEMPADPADYLEYLYSLNLFETSSYSAEDAKRTQKYQTHAQRLTSHKLFTNQDEYLQSLNMCSIVEPFNRFNLPRVAQLTQRSNQFNLRTVRYSEAQIEGIANSDKSYSFSFTLEDSFGDNGLVCVVILEEEDENYLFIDTWLMSCRILKRGMEQFVLNTITAFAREKKFNFLIGEYLPTAKNGLVKDHYSNLGFDHVNGKWSLNLKEYKSSKSYIAKKDKR